MKFSGVAVAIFNQEESSWRLKIKILDWNFRVAIQLTLKFGRFYIFCAWFF